MGELKHTHHHDHHSLLHTALSCKNPLAPPTPAAIPIVAVPLPSLSQSVVQMASHISPHAELVVIKPSQIMIPRYHMCTICVVMTASITPLKIIILLQLPVFENCTCVAANLGLRQFAENITTEFLSDEEFIPTSTATEGMCVTYLGLSFLSHFLLSFCSLFLTCHPFL